MTVQSPQPVQPKKGLGPLGWILIGCGGIVILCLIALGVAGYLVKRQVGKFAKNPGMAVAELVVRANPDLELVKVDEGAQTITVRNKKDNQVLTVNLEDAKKGKFEFKSDKGTATLNVQGGENGGQLTVTDEKGQKSTFSAGGGGPQSLPSWVPSYPGGTVQGSYDSKTNEARAAGFTVNTKDGVDTVLKFYTDKLKEAGFNPQQTAMSANGKASGGTVTATTPDEKRSVNVIVSSSGTETQAIVTFSEKP
jgi:hypothetical protein